MTTTQVILLSVALATGLVVYMTLPLWIQKYRYAGEP